MSQRINQIVRKLLLVFRPSADDEIEQVEKRIYGRFCICQEDAVQLVLMEAGIERRFQVRDLSYGGLAIAVSGGDLHAFPGDGDVPVSARLLCFGREVPASVRFVFAAPNRGVVGLCFDHSNMDTLKGLRELLEALKLGSNLRETTQAALSEKYRTGNWRVYRGLGPSDFCVRLSEGLAPQIEEAVVTLREGESYLELSLRDGEWRSAQSAPKVAVGRPSAQMMRERDVPLGLVQRVCTILVGYEDSGPKAQLSHEGSGRNLKVSAEAEHPLRLLYRLLNETFGPKLTAA